MVFIIWQSSYLIQSDNKILNNRAAKLRYSENFAYNMYSYCFFINISI